MSVVTLRSAFRWDPPLWFAVVFDDWLRRWSGRIEPPVAMSLLERTAGAIPRELHGHVKIGVVGNGLSVTLGNYLVVGLWRKWIYLAGPVLGPVAEIPPRHHYLSAPDWRMYSFGYGEAARLCSDQHVWDDVHDASRALVDERQGRFLQPPGSRGKLPLSAVFVSSRPSNSPSRGQAPGTE